MHRIAVFICLLSLVACSPIPQVSQTSPSIAKGSNTTSITLKPKSVPDTKTNLPQVSIEWLSPVDTDSLKAGGDKILIKIRIKSDKPITKDQIEVLINGQSPGNKAGEVSLTSRPEYKDNIYSSLVPVSLGRNEVQVMVTLSAEQRYANEKILERDAQKIRVISNQTNSTTRILWSFPDVFALRSNEIYSTKNNEQEIKLNISSPDKINLSKIKLLLNRVYKAPSLTAEFRDLGAGNYAFRDIVTLNEKETVNEITLVVEASSGKASSQKLKVNYSPLRPNLYVLAIGTKTTLKYTTKDARDFAQIYTQQGNQVYRLFNTVTIDTLIGAAASTAKIRFAIEAIRNKINVGSLTPDDIVFLFFSSHGFIDENKDFRIQGDDFDPLGKSSTSVSYKSDILAQIQNLPCKKILFIDACRSGGAKANNFEIIQAIHDLKNAPNGLTVMTSSSEQEDSHEDVRWQNGAFTEALISGLRDGKADTNGNGIITINEISSYVMREVPIMVQAVKRQPQHPKLNRNELNDIPVFILKNN